LLVQITNINAYISIICGVEDIAKYTACDNSIRLIQP
jgi:hypothetical protein